MYFAAIFIVVTAFQQVHKHTIVVPYNWPKPVFDFKKNHSFLHRFFWVGCYFTTLCYPATILFPALPVIRSILLLLMLIMPSVTVLTTA
jgi:hypothetical protein